MDIWLITHRRAGIIELRYNYFADITFMEDCGRDNDNVINCPTSQLPAGYLERRN
jgi:phenolic acid decarboxylase